MIALLLKAGALLRHSAGALKFIALPAWPEDVYACCCDENPLP
jgi:hypothetical protein